MTSLLWTFPLLMFTSIVIGWAAEVTAVHLSAGMALAVLAWLQCLPEFAVEASIAWSRNEHLALANLTGSLRLLMGLGWPMIFFIHWYAHGRGKKKSVRDVTLPASFAVEAAGLGIPVVYFIFIWLKGTWSAFDGVILCGFYGLYFWMLNHERKHGVQCDDELDEEDEDEPWLVEKILHQKNAVQYAMIVGLFVFGGVTLYFVVHPFVESLKAAALALGVSEFVFIQWVAPVASEFPEKVTAFNWARNARKVPMAVVNMLSSVTSQWTLLAGLVPIIFSISAGHAYTIHFTEFQKMELLLTIAQSALAVVFLADLKIMHYEAIGLFVLWLAQFVMPTSHLPITIAYISWFAWESGRLMRNPKDCVAWATLRKIFFHGKGRRPRGAS